VKKNILGAIRGVQQLLFLSEKSKKQTLGYYSSTQASIAIQLDTLRPYDQITMAHLAKLVDTNASMFTGDEGWRILVGLCRAESWCDVVDFLFAVLCKWVEGTRVFNANFRLHVPEFVNICTDPVYMAFWWNIV
jgi:hypothetical protein